MLERLMKVSGDASMRDRLYSVLLNEAGAEFNGTGIVMILMGAVRDYVGTMNAPKAYEMCEQLPNFIDALVDDPEVASQAKVVLKETIPLMTTLFPPKQPRKTK